MEQASDLKLVTNPATDEDVPWLADPTSSAVHDALGEVPTEDVAGQLGTLLESEGIRVLGGVGDRGGDERRVAGFRGCTEVLE
ncbi:MAG TPA: hypothetical protein VNZ66_11260 [Aeromicrobium sp.]|nr:hypothetical protein [Aeromicrobium sp.]